MLMKCFANIFVELFGEQQKKTVTLKDSSPAGTEDSLPKKPAETNQRIPACSSDDQRLQTSFTVETSGLLYHANYTDHTLQSNLSFDYPTLPPPPQHFYPFQYPPPPPPWELPRVPSAHATLPAYLQNIPPPPPPPPPPSTEPSVQDNFKTSEESQQERPFTVYMSQVMIGPQLEEGYFKIW